MPAFGSPWLFADRCALLRLPVPRHSPCALLSLTALHRVAPASCRPQSNHARISSHVRAYFRTRARFSFLLPLFSSQGPPVFLLCKKTSSLPMPLLRKVLGILGRLIAQSIWVLPRERESLENASHSRRIDRSIHLDRLSRIMRKP